MAYQRLPDNTPELLRAAGLKVTVLPGWKTRGRPASKGGFNPVGVLCHHTATTVTWTIAAVLRLLTGGRTGLPGPLAQFGLSRKGRVYIIAAGRANHAGHARPVGSVAAGDGNYLYIGIEAFNNGRGEPWPAVQYDAYVLLCAVLCLHVTGNSWRTVAGHKETSTTGKVDPTFDMDKFRARVAAQIEQVASRPDEEEEMDWDRLEQLLDKKFEEGGWRIKLKTPWGGDKDNKTHIQHVLKELWDRLTRLEQKLDKILKKLGEDDGGSGSGEQ